jgi:hypothetical protein
VSITFGPLTPLSNQAIHCHKAVEQGIREAVNQPESWGYSVCESEFHLLLMEEAHVELANFFLCQHRSACVFRWITNSRLHRFLVCAGSFLNEQNYLFSSGATEESRLIWPIRTWYGRISHVETHAELSNRGFDRTQRREYSTLPLEGEVCDIHALVFHVRRVPAASRRCQSSDSRNAPTSR